MITRKFTSTGKAIWGKTIDAKFFYEEENAHNCQASNNGVEPYYVRDLFEEHAIIGFTVSSEDKKMIDHVVMPWLNSGYIKEIY